MTTQLGPLSACVTRILALSGFNPQLKTKDIQQAFSDWDNVQGGFKIKWVDDTSLYIVFQDPAIAKRAYLQALFSPPPTLSSPTAIQLAQIKPYDGPDAQNVIQAVNARGGGNGGTHVRGHSSRASIAVGGGINGAHARMGSGHNNNNRSVSATGPYDTISQSITLNTLNSLSLSNREPSPTLPNLPSQPSLNALISSSLSGEHIADEGGMDQVGAVSGGPPRIGDPGKRMVAHQLGVKHPGLNRSHSGGELNSRMQELQRNLRGVTLAE